MLDIVPESVLYYSISKLKEWLDTGKIKLLEDAENDPEFIFSNVYSYCPFANNIIKPTKYFFPVISFL